MNALTPCVVTGSAPLTPWSPTGSAGDGGMLHREGQWCCTVLREGLCTQQHPYGGGIPCALLGVPGSRTISVLVFQGMLLCDPVHMSV